MNIRQNVLEKQLAKAKEDERTLTQKVYFEMTGTYGEKYVTLLVHWNKSPRDTEKAATELFEKLKVARDVNVNNETIKFFQPLYDVQDVGTDDAGIYEMVIEGVFIYEKKEGKQA